MWRYALSTSTFTRDTSITSICSKVLTMRVGSKRCRELRERTNTERSQPSCRTQRHKSSCTWQRRRSRQWKTTRRSRRREPRTCPQQSPQSYPMRLWTNPPCVQSLGPGHRSLDQLCPNSRRRWKPRGRRRCPWNRKKT